ncbi:ATP-binding cassette domain-containing protein [Aquiflexum gelatinilyticum]|uniref:ATP-binding cassette domain-containing protein n=1 Tax=Aquiflexum gelatinilyticum TaxID=2961943 RepID=A0A9X2P6J1_9BACT|nr:ATP-binding cassette domain-containing protein [Aquiflexum gelatinilyticum]MCR9014024.1 ATP-binding cassette domain-containing protein [Aquiflexum gelatinilyticum]
MSSLISIQKATVRQFDKVVFENLDFEWERGQHWAILGQSGVELTAFLDTILGKTMVTSGIIQRAFAKEYQEQKSEAGEVNSFRDLIATVSQQYSFKNKSNIQNFYYQQRFNSMESDEALTVKDYLKNIEVKVPGPWSLSKVIRFMNLEHLKDKSLIKLSNGETRRLSFASALIKNPKILLMDQPLTGLDKGTRDDFGSMVSDIIASGIHVLMSTHHDEIPSSISHVGFLSDKNISIVSNFENLNSSHQNWLSENQIDTGTINSLLVKEEDQNFQKIVELRNVSIQYGNKQILEGVDWTILPNEKWALKGQNGAGKSTLLSLILAENPQAYSNEIYLFDKKRGSGESIWDIKKQIGFVAPELSRFFPSNQTCLKVILSGLFDTMGLFKKVSPEQEKSAIDWLVLFGLENVAHILFNRVPLENQRFILLARALIKRPKLLVMDEASQGMDDLQRVRFRETIDIVSKIFPLAMVYVSHYEEDIPKCVDKILRLSNGKVVF